MNATPLLIVIGYVWPEPNSSAAGSRMLSLLKLYLAQGWRVMFASAAEQGPHRYPLSALGISEHNIALNDSSFEHWLAGVNPQAVMFDRFMLEEQFGWRVEQQCPQALRLLEPQQRALGQEPLRALAHRRGSEASGSGPSRATQSRAGAWVGAN